ncbi:hypothetical protein PC116_g15677 [Phytophthora cactorum]|uniref:Uncharacterized protein n=1 Tax=Phytophthora cactorum TaxID=29920 RepID=A0A8T1KM53_9STRA|nr:hypothetical protein PC111_g12406 [Phytophthora cactorum]KAG2901972.1 hypothetical protein PC114_g12928 [Phytophthora cactorum]KAG2916837.1 hypothetical protein PC117_g17607 [Phytophthora cactorum]KAG2979331.1 hypothetical protein PC118_g11812 [Phytophthora cactorum]KAG3080974.1 hypothetical protein PC122_g11503 [Phytophthora cactorum]
MELGDEQASCCAQVGRDYTMDAENTTDAGVHASEDSTENSTSDQQIILPTNSEDAGLTEVITKVYELLPPLQHIYRSEVEAETAIHQWTLRHGYNITKKQLERNNNGDIVYRLFACDQWGKPNTLDILVIKIT